MPAPAQPALIPLPGPGLVNPPPPPPPQAPVFTSSPPMAADPAPLSCRSPARTPTPAPVTTAPPPVFHPVPPPHGPPSPTLMPARASASSRYFHPVPPEFSTGAALTATLAPTSAPQPVLYPVPPELTTGLVTSPPPSDAVIEPAQCSASSSPPASSSRPASPRAAPASVPANGLPAAHADGMARLDERSASDGAPMAAPSDTPRDPPTSPSMFGDEEFPALGPGSGEVQSAATPIRAGSSASNGAGRQDAFAQPAPVCLDGTGCCACFFFRAPPSSVPAEDPHAPIVSGDSGLDMLNSRSG